MPLAPVASRVHPSDFSWSDSEIAADLRRIADAATEADGRAPLNEAALLALRHHGLARATLFVAQGAGVESSVAGFAVVHTASGTQEPADLNLVVSPEFRRRGLGGLLAARVSDEFAATPLSAWSHGNHPGAAALAARNGFARVRDLWVMRRPLRGDLPPLDGPAAEADGIDVRPFRPGTDEEAVLTVNARAFADHPEQGAMTLADLHEREREPWFDPAGFFLAWRGDRLLGFHWTKVHGPAQGEVYVVGVDPDAQGSGLGRLLTLTGLHHLAGRGVDEVILYVEADNAPAVAVYTKLGFTHAAADTDVMYQRAGRPPA
ncbi:MAG: mycothiol synthase [Nocardioidaceae bacterium]